ncbi:MAG: hypothetical protein AAF962_27310 [Actinomycetota bacterium]
MQLFDEPRAGGLRIAVLGTGHLVMLVVMFALLERYKPEPNGFRFDTPMKLGTFAVITLPPIVIGSAAQRIEAVSFVALVHAASPLLLLGNMRNPGSDLNFALVLWWLPLPAAAGLVVLIDRLEGISDSPNRRSWYAPPLPTQYPAMPRG